MFNNYSRYKRSDVMTDDDGNLFTSIPDAMPYVGGTDDVAHVVVDGDTLTNLAYRYYGSLPNPATFWWAIAHYQPEPIIDPTQPLQAGDTLIIPSVDAVQSWVMSARDEEGLSI